jgi:hypothetical protein
LKSRAVMSLRLILDLLLYFAAWPGFCYITCLTRCKRETYVIFEYAALYFIDFNFSKSVFSLVNWFPDAERCNFHTLLGTGPGFEHLFRIG